MVRPHSMFRRAAPLCLALMAGLAAPAPAAAQYVGPWGQAWGGAFGPPARIYGPAPDVIDDDVVSPREVSGVLRAHGYRLVGAPRRSGENLIAFGEAPGGQRARFIIDAYDGDLLQMIPTRGAPAVGRNVPPGDVALGAPVDLDNAGPDGRMGAGGLPTPMIDRLPNAPKPPRATPKARTASHAPAERRSPTASQTLKKPPAPSQAIQAPPPPLAAPAPVAPPPETPAQTAVAPSPAPAPLAPDVKPEVKPDANSADAKPADIGPRVQPVEARAPAASPTPAAPENAPAAQPAASPAANAPEPAPKP